ncbi:MAG TPA: nitroreductase family protein [Gemmatimonadales bacterium]|nr:nitroreductase family protein [Gemmatimonadales bacterium]
MTAVPVVASGEEDNTQVNQAESADDGMPANAAEIVERVIRERRTRKILAEQPLEARSDREALNAIVASAGWAPFHRKASQVYQDEGDLRSIVPWRCYVLDARAARELREWMEERGEAGPMLRLLAACSAMVLVTWLPDQAPEADAPVRADEQLFEPTLENMEHIAAASAAVQNMLLSATARGYRTFWSTAKPLRAPESLGHLGIPLREVLLGAIHLAAPDVEGSDEKHGSHGSRRGEPGDWMRWL